MTGEQLKEELARIAAAAPRVEVPDDLFARGRRATTLARVLVAAAAVACFALVVGIGAPLVTSDDAPFADEDPPVGVPDVIYGPPLHEQSFDLPTTPLDEVGPATVAYQVDDGEEHVVLVTREGEYRSVLLPDRWEPDLDDTTPVLSPDGLRLAYASQRDLVRGLSVVDLTTGEVREVTLGPDPGAQAATLQWSPDGRWLVWSGQQVKEARESGASYVQGTIAGVVGPGATHSRALPALPGNRWNGAGICDDGAVLRVVSRVFRVHQGADVDRVRSWSRLTAEHGGCSAPRRYFRHPGPEHFRVLGWLPANPGDPGPVAVVQIENSRLVLAWPQRARERVGRVELGWSRNLSVATGLMTADRPTVEAGPSPWDRPWIVEHWREVLAFLAVGAITILILVRARLVRR